jgi:hypothetical protein
MEAAEDQAVKTVFHTPINVLAQAVFSVVAAPAVRATQVHTVSARGHLAQSELSGPV